MPSPDTTPARRALITGAGRGVGRAVAKALAARGVDVTVNDVDATSADAVVAELRELGGRAEADVFDLTDPAAVRARAARDFDIVVNNAGNAGRDGWGDMPLFVDTEPADWDRFFAINLYAPMLVTRAALPAMIERGWGRVITVVSDAGRVGEPRLVAYGAAKAGAAGFTRGLAREVGRHGVTVNAVSLGSLDAGGERRVPSRYAMPRLGTPQDAAAAVAYLAGDDAGWVTGQTVAVNGGYSSTL